MWNFICKKAIHRDIEYFRQRHQGRDVGGGFADFVIGICGSVDIQYFSDLALRETAFDAQFPETFANA